MSETILVNATYPGNTRVVILDEHERLSELIFEGAQTQPSRSNIYLGTVARVEHSLQAAFVDYGYEKSGFLPFADIHPDYYQIPAFDREQLRDYIKNASINQDSAEDQCKGSDSYSNDCGMRNHYNVYKRYNIQEVIKRGQNVLVQVYRDERGNKGAALTTYISLAGRYCVFMPNSPNGIGISHKISDAEDRQRILAVASKFPLIETMSLIIRTAAQDATPEALYRDYKYLVNLWNDIRNLTMQSKTMSIIHTEEKIVKQVMRDHYSNNVKQVIVEGKSGYDEVLECFEHFAPDDKSKLVKYQGRIPLFTKYGIEQQIDELLVDRVNLPSGGYLIIEQTEALVAVDVNSGRATSEKNIEETALHINLEAAAEIARQLRLRDLGGLAVIDFIDMAELRHRKMVETHLRNHVYNDRAKVQFTRISHFGLLELSRQRLRSSLMEINTNPCTTCLGSGRVKSNDVIANTILRALEASLHKSKYDTVHVDCSKEALSALASKQELVSSIENSNKVKISVIANEGYAADIFSIKAKDGSTNEDFKHIFKYDGNRSTTPQRTNKTSRVNVRAEVVMQKEKMQVRHVRKGISNLIDENESDAFIAKNSGCDSNDYYTVHKKMRNSDTVDGKVAWKKRRDRVISNNKGSSRISRQHKNVKANRETRQVSVKKPGNLLMRIIRGFIGG